MSREVEGPRQCRRAVAGAGVTGVAVALALVLVLALVLAGCSGGGGRGGGGPGGRAGAPTATVTPGPATPERVAVQPGDLSPRFHRCDFSGDVDSYIAAFKEVNPSTYQSLTQTWRQLQAAGATGGYFAVYGDADVACNDVLGKATDHDESLHDDPKGHPTTVWSFVARYRDAEAAAAAYRADVFGQTHLKDQAFEVVEGEPTGLGPNSTVGTNQADAPVRQAVWQNTDFTVFYGSENLQPLDSERVTSAIDGRIARR